MVVNNVIQLVGLVALRCWNDVPRHYPFRNAVRLRPHRYIRAALPLRYGSLRRDAAFRYSAVRDLLAFVVWLRALRAPHTFLRPARTTAQPRFTNWTIIIVIIAARDRGARQQCCGTSPYPPTFNDASPCNPDTHADGARMAAACGRGGCYLRWMRMVYEILA